jgi:hypothetical protein
LSLGFSGISGPSLEKVTLRGQKVLNMGYSTLAKIHGTSIFDAGRFQLLGRTPTGYATIDQLKMNTSYQIEARKYWVEAGLYP